MSDLRLPDGSQLLYGFRREPGGRYWHAPDLTGVLQALRAFRQDAFFMQDLRRVYADSIGHPVDDEDLFRRVASAVESGRLAWELPPPPVLPKGGSSGPSESEAAPASKPASSPAPKPAPAPAPQSSPPPKSAPPPKPASPPPPKPAAPPPPKPAAPPSPPVVVPVVAAVSVGAADGLRRRDYPPRPPEHTHNWIIDPARPGMSVSAAADDNFQKVEKARKSARPPEGTIRGHLFEIWATASNIARMDIQCASRYYICACGQEQEVDIVGKTRLGEAKSKSLQLTKDDMEDQPPRLLSIQKQHFSDSKPLAKLDTTRPKISKIKNEWEKAGFEVEMVNPNVG